MAHFALVNKDNLVVQVIVIDNKDLNNLDFPESEEVGRSFISSLNLDEEDHTWMQTSYNNNFRGAHASSGFSYIEELDIFIYQKPFDSWIIDLSKKPVQWVPPIPLPKSLEEYFWDEASISWKK